MTDVTDSPLLGPVDAARLSLVDRDSVVHSWAAQDEYVPDLVTRAEGNYFWDAEGKRYLDFTSQAWFANIGHGNERVAAAVAEQVSALAAIWGHGTPPKLRLTEKLLALVPEGYRRVFFGCNGSDAVEVALKVARLVTGRQNIVTFYGEYHGSSMGAASVTGLSTWRSYIGQPVPGTIFIPPPYRYRGVFAADTQDEADEAALDFLRRTIENANPDTIAAVLGEPIVTGGPPVFPGPRYWKGVRGICDDFNLLLIADEVVTGFGRTGNWFARDHYDYRPDILCFAKGLTAGYLPLSAAVFSAAVSDRFESDILPHGLTYSGHPVCCAAALATIEVLEQDGLVDNAAAMGRHLGERLSALAAAHPCVGHAENLGLYAAMELVRPSTGEGFPWQYSRATRDNRLGHPTGRVVSEMKNRGVIVRNNQGFISFAPPLTITAAEIDSAFEALHAALAPVDELVT